MKNILTLFFCFIVTASFAQTDSVSSKTDLAVSTDSVYTKVDVEAQFPGGEKKLNKFVQNIIVKNIDLLTTDAANRGTCTFRFIVDTEGNISAVRAMNMEGSSLAKTMANSIQNGPKWIPAKLNSVNVKSRREQKITLRF